VEGDGASTPTRSRRRWEEHTDDIDSAEVLRRFRAISRRAVWRSPPAGGDPERDPALIALLQEAYVRYPVPPEQRA
jgi:hypothetical protein